MEKIKGFLWFIFAVISFNAHLNAQRIEKGLIKTDLTLSPSKMLKLNPANFYLHGNIDIYLNSSYSFSGTAYYYLGQLNSDTSFFEKNHSLFYGISKHWVKSNNDLYVSFQPGMSVTQIRNNLQTLLPISPRQIAVNPMASLACGYNLYVAKIFHFFSEIRFVTGNNNKELALNLSELRFSAGLGFNLNTIEKK